MKIDKKKAEDAPDAQDSVRYRHSRGVAKSTTSFPVINQEKLIGKAGRTKRPETIKEALDADTSAELISQEVS